ncbi:tape measure protein [Enterobacter roggenkampii]|uniref:tape measure protein n=1 Tax=Enterobacter roggenkampii TaxID=1812935 RepID=UPI003D68065F
MGELAGKLYDLKQAQDQANASQQKSAGIMGGLKTGLTAIASAIAVSQVVQYGKQFLEIADAMTQLQARIDRLSPSAKEGAATFQALASIASSSGASLKDTEKLWETLTSSLQSAGATNGQILALTDTLQKIGRIGGSSSEEMANALRQFGQSIAGGTVRAEEFNSIIEQMPELARQMAAGLGLSVGELRKRMLEGKLSAEDALNAIMSQTGNVNQEFGRLPRTVDQATNSLIISFQEMIKQINDATGASTGMVHVIDSITAAIDRLSGKVPTVSQQIADLNSTAEMFSRRARTYSMLGLDGWAAQAEGINVVSNKAAALAADLAAVSKASTTAANASPIKVGGTGDSKEVEKLEKSTKRKLELSKLEGEARARLQAQYDAEDAGIKDNGRIKALQDEYAATERNTSARKKSTAEGKKAASQADSIAQKLVNLKQQSELAADSTNKLSREQAILTAQQSLGKGATKEQIALAGQYAAKKWDTANAIKAQAAAEKLLPEARENASYKQDVEDLNTALAAKKISQEQFNQTSERLEATHQANLAKIRAQQAVTPQQDAVGGVDPVQQLANENARKLALIQAFEQQGLITHQNALMLRATADREYEQARIAAQWEIFRNQSAGNEALAASFDALAGNASNALTGIITGSMSASDALRSIGNTVLNSLINTFVQMGVEWVKSAIMGQTATTAAVAASTTAQAAGIATTTATSTAAAAATTAAWTPAAIMSSVASFGGAVAIGLGAMAGILALSGKRKNGGPVSAGGMYQVGEGGMPEIYQASTGKQYMIPGDNGKVISNKEMTGGGGGGVILNINNYSSASVDAQATQGSDGTWTIDAFIADMNNGGPASQAITSNMNVKRTPRGQG